MHFKLNVLSVKSPQFIFSLATVILSGKYLERVWGQNGFLLFVAAVVVASNAIAVGVNVLEHFVFQDSGLLLWVVSFHIPHPVAR